VIEDSYMESRLATIMIADVVGYSRLYKCAALMALERVEEAKLAMQQALAINPELSAIAFMRKESWRNAALRIDIRNDLVEAGMPKKITIRN
jgi:hypothetical protein